MGKIRKFVFINVSLFCLVFLLACLSSVYAVTKTNQNVIKLSAYNERFVLKHVPLNQSNGPISSRAFFVSLSNNEYSVTNSHQAGYLIWLTIARYSHNSGVITLPNQGMQFNIKKLEDVDNNKVYESLAWVSMSGISHPGYYPTIWLEGSEHTILGKVEFFGYKLVSDRNYPLVFKMVKDSGYTYLCGCGTVTDKDGKIYKLGYDDTVDKWFPLLKSDDQLDREGATQALGWLAKTKEDIDKAVPALIEVLSDNVPGMRAISAESLGRIGDSRAKETLEKIAKDDKDDWVREVAEESIGLIEVKEATTRLANGDKTAIDDLAKALNHKWFLVRRTAVDSLAKAGSEAVNPLITALKNDDSEVRIKSAEALAKIGDKKAIEPLNKALAEEKDEDVKKAFEEAIRKLKE